ncbi:MAG TPA: cytochrome c-type biogenesis protein CcmH [Anaerolineaceae bacterium]|nr:cytochrome c-type biogenesis protein CcmH [Anaerolineaceae bacterium]
MNKHSKLIGILFGLVLIACLPSVVLAQDATPISPVTDDLVNAVAHDLYCPVCENIPLDVCPTQACAQWRALIREKLELGWSTSQINDFFAEQYGEKVLSVPSARGFNWALYILPPVIIISLISIGVLVAYLLVRRFKQKPGSIPQAPTSVTTEVLDEIEQDLQKER